MIFFQLLPVKNYHEHEKVVVSQQITDLNIFKGVLTGAALRKNTTYWLIMLYSFLIYLMNYDKIKEMDFRRRLRVVVNLLKIPETKLSIPLMVMQETVCPQIFVR